MDEWFHPLVAVAVAVFGGLGTGITIGIWLSKRELARVFDVVDRMPPIEWFDDVRLKLAGFDPERLRLHYDRGHAHAQQLQAHEMRIAKNERGLDDHEHRLRAVERKT